MTVAWPAGDFARATTGNTRWKRHAALLGLAWAGLLLLFVRDAVGLVEIWWTNAAFGHCLFIPPVIGWLVWQRRRELAQVVPAAWWPGLALVGLGGLAWLVGDAASLALARHVGLILMLQGAAIALLGPNVSRALTFPIAYMLFLIPVGEQLEAPLQSLTVEMVMPLLHLFDVPATVDGVLITTPNGWFEVAEACSGARFVIAMAAFGALVANVCYVSWRRRAAFLAMALIVPLFANGVRAFATIYVAWWTSVEAATGMDHIVYGWVFFALVMAGVLALGWRWFDRDPDARWFDPAKFQAPVRGRIDPVVAALLVPAIAALFLAWSGFGAARAAPLPARVELPDVPGWTRAPLSDTAPWAPAYPGADHFLIGRYADARGRTVDLAVALYASQHEGKELVGYGIGPLGDGERWIRIADLPALEGGKALRMAGPGRVERETITWNRVGGALTGDEKQVKLETLKTRLLGRDPRAAAVALSAERVEGGDTRRAIQDFLTALGPVDVLADRMSEGR